MLAWCINAGVTLISVVHRPTAVCFHKKLLHGEYDTAAGGRKKVKWTLSEIPSHYVDKYVSDTYLTPI